MISEVWEGVQFDVARLESHLRDQVLPLTPVFQSMAFGGWSVLSSNGHYADGWHQGHKLHVEGADVNQVHRELAIEGARPSVKYNVPTEICTGYLAEVIEVMRSYDLMPHRVRIIQLTPQSACAWHRDAADDVYAVRLHIPILTNPGCFFETETEREHLPADGRGYFIHVNRTHRVVNEGDTYRYHIVADVRDLSGATKFHRYPDAMSESGSQGEVHP